MRSKAAVESAGVRKKIRNRCEEEERKVENCLGDSGFKDIEERRSRNTNAIAVVLRSSQTSEGEGGKRETN